GGALFLTDDADALPAKAAEAADDRLVAPEFPVAGPRAEVLDQLPRIVQAMRPLRMARHLRLLPRRQVGVAVLQLLRRLLLKARHFIGNGHRVAIRLRGAQFLDLGVQLGLRLFEIEVAAHAKNRGLSRDLAATGRGNWRPRSLKSSKPPRERRFRARRVGWARRSAFGQWMQVAHQALQPILDDVRVDLR